MIRRLLGLLAVAALLACATSPTGRRQLKLFPEAEMAQMGVAAYSRMKSELPVSRDTRAAAYVRCVAAAVTAAIDDPRYARTAWEVTLFEEQTPNAFALPGGKIGVHTGLLRVARTQDQLAAVIGHEVAHVLADHSNERVSTTFATRAGVDLVAAIAGASSPAQRQILSALGVGAVVLPHSRAQESEADTMGLELMARAGFDPAAAIDLWRNMAAAGGGQPPEFLSTHPSHGTRIQSLEARIPAARALMSQARARGRRPACG